METPNLQLSFFQTLCLTPSLVKNIREILLSTFIWKFCWPELYDLKHERLINFVAVDGPVVCGRAELLGCLKLEGDQCNDGGFK